MSSTTEITNKTDNGLVVESWEDRVDEVVIDASPAPVETKIIEETKKETKTNNEILDLVKSRSISETSLDIPSGLVKNRKDKYKNNKEKVLTNYSTEGAIRALTEKKIVPSTDVVRSRMCNSLGTDIPCQHAGRCRYAHTLEELVINKCMFEGCRFVTFVDGVYTNSTTERKVCERQHKEETRENYYVRIDLIKYKDIVVKPFVEKPKSLAYTQMCTSVKAGIKCGHKKCTFAHTIDELVVSSCFFGKRCRFIIETDGRFSNKTKQNICGKKHDGESEEDFCIRLDIPQKPLSIIDTTDIVVKPMENLIVNPIKKPVKKIDDEIVIIRVPKSMAEMALKMAWESGKTNIKIEITDQ